MKKKCVLVLLSCIMTMTLFGCNKTTEPVSEVVDTPTEEVSVEENTPTEEIVEEVDNNLSSCVDGLTSFDGTLAMSVKMQIPMSQAEKEKYESLGNDSSYAYHNFNTGISLNVNTTETITHYQGTLSKVGDAVVANPINSYTDETAKKYYDLSYNEKTGSQTWVQSEDYTASFLSIVKDIVKHTVVSSENNASTTRINKGTVNSKYLMAIPCLNTLNNTYFTLNKDAEVALPVKLTISSKTGYIANIELTLDELLKADNVSSLSTEPMKIVLGTLNSTNVAIPEEALNTTGESLALVDEDICVYSKYFKSIYSPETKEATDDISQAIIHAVIGNKYDVMLVNADSTSEEDAYTEAMHQVTDFLNYYSVNDLQAYMKYYKYCSEEEQAVICIVAQLGIPGFDEKFMQENCIGSNTLDTVIMSYINDYNIQ